MTVHDTRTSPQRSHGEALVTLADRAGTASLVRLRQAGSAKAILPGTSGGVTEVVFLNTSGGLTGGDRLAFDLTLGPRCRAVATTQTAERVYRSDSGPARVAVRLEVGAGGRLDWLPQETIVFQDASLDRRTDIMLGPGAECLLLEAVVLGRAAMGETVTRTRLHDTRRVWRDGVPVLVEGVRLEGGGLVAGFAALGDARAFASLALVAPGAADALAPVRAVLDEAGVTAAASAFDGKLTVRMTAGDGWPMRRQILRVLACLRRDPLPRVWQT